MLQGGHHPEYGVEYYEELFSAVKAAYPQLVIHSIGPSEILHMAKVSGVSIEDAVRRIKAAGLDSIAGAGAEMLPRPAAHGDRAAQGVRRAVAGGDGDRPPARASSRPRP